MNVRYTDKQGLTWVTSVPAEATPDMYRWGVPVGPPDLSSLGLEKKEWVALQAALVDMDLIVAPQLMGKRAEIKLILKKLGLPEYLLKEIISLYQQAYYAG